MEKKILVVEDEPEVVNLLRTRLEANHYGVMAAGNGVEGLKQIELEKPDLILLDILMPGLDGIATLQKLKAEKSSPRCDVWFGGTWDAHAEAAELLPALAAVQPVFHWAGLRPGSPGNIPLIDRHPDFENVFVNTGHFRYGVTMAPASAELLADMMDGKVPALDPAPYRWQAALERRWGEAP